MSSNRPSTGSPERDRVRNLVLLCVGMGVSFIAQTMLLLAVPLRALELGASPATVGGLLSAPFWLPMLLAIPLGRLVTRLGARRMMLIGATGLTLGPWAAVVFPGMAGLLVTQLVIGLMQITMGISAQSTIASLARGKSLERFFGWYTTSVSSGQLLGPLAGGLLIDAFGTRAVFPLIGTIPLVSMSCASLLVGAATVGHKTTQSLLGYSSQVTLLRRNVAVQVSIVVTIAMMFVMGAHAAFFPVYLESLQVPAALIGLLVSLRALSSTVVRPLMAAIITLLGGRSRTITACIFAAAIGLMLTGTSQQVVILAILAALIGIGTGLAQPLTMVAIADHVPVYDRSSALGLRLTVNQGAQVLGPLVLGAVAELAGFTVMFIAGGALLLGLLVLVRRLVPEFDLIERSGPTAAGV